MVYNPDKHHRRSIRLPQYDYAQPGLYFVTICTHERECVLGDVVDGVMVLNDWGMIADRYWTQVAAHFQGVMIDTYVVMPNHVHVNLHIVSNPTCRGGVTPSGSNACGVADVGGETPPLQVQSHAVAGRGGGGVAPPGSSVGGVAGVGGETPPLQPALGQIIAQFKYQTTKTINAMRGTPGVRFWQRNYWEHVARNEAEMSRIQEYIHNNPASWNEDQLHPAAQPNQFNLVRP